MKTIRDLIVLWHEEYKNTKSYIKDSSYLKGIEHYLDYPLNQFFTQEVFNTIVQKKKDAGNKPATINRSCSILNTLRRLAKEHYNFDSSATPKYQKHSNQVVRWITHEESIILLKELPTHVTNMVLFSLHTGLRKSNVINLKWEDVDLANKRIIIKANESKSGKAIGVPLDDEVIRLLTSLKRDSEYVFTYKGHRVLQPNNRTWTKALKRAGIKDFRWHDLRHTWASWHIQKGTPIEILMRLGGWNNYNMVLRYAHLGTNDLLKWVNN